MELMRGITTSSMGKPYKSREKKIRKKRREEERKGKR